MSAYNYVSSLRPDDSGLMAKYSTPVPPSPFSLLEDSSRDNMMSSKVKLSDNRDSLLLDTNDDMGMELLVSSASVDSEGFRILSFEEVERLKREKALLTSRIESHTRKLALESKVRDASQNLVRLHANKNKRLSKQAEDQLQNAARKVDDLATDLWRLQRREATIKQQLLEHMAGVLSRRLNQVRPSENDLDFGGRHLYKDSSASYRDSMATRVGHLTSSSEIDPQTPALSQSSVSDLVTRAETRLRETNKQLRQFLDGYQPNAAHNAYDDAEDADLDIHIDQLDSALLTLQEQHLQHKEKSLHAVDSQKTLLSDLWKSIGEHNPPDNSDKALLEHLSGMSQEVQVLRLDVLESDNRVNDLEEQHSRSMKQMQSEYEVELDDVQTELDQMREEHATLLEEVTTLRAERSTHQETRSESDARVQALQDEMRQAQNTVGDLIVREAAIKHESSVDKASIRELEQRLAEVEDQSLAFKNEADAALQTYQNKVHDLEDKIAKYEAEIVVLRDRNELCLLELQSHDLSRNAELRTHETELAELHNKHRIALQHIELISAEKQDHSKQVDDMRSQAREQVESLHDELKQLRTELRDREIRDETSQSRAEQEITLQDLEAEVVRLMTENTQAKAELDELRGSKLDTERLQTEAAQSLLVRDMGTKLGSLEGELEQAFRLNQSLQHEIGVLQMHRSTDVSPMTISKHFEGGLSEREAALEARCTLLQAELDSMLLEYEAMTRSALFYESERTKQENKTDELLDRVIDLETQLADEKVRLLGVSPGSPIPGSPSEPRTPPDGPTTAGLRRDFRRLVQEMRTEHAKRTKEDYGEIRRLERKLAAAMEKALSHEAQRTLARDVE